MLAVWLRSTPRAAEHHSQHGTARSIHARGRVPAPPASSSSTSRPTRASMASRAASYPSLTAGTSSHRSTSTVGPSGARSQPNVTIRVADATSSDDTRRGRRPWTSMPSARSSLTTRGAMWASGSVPANVASTRSPRRSARRWKCVAAITLFAAPCRHTNRMRGSAMGRLHSQVDCESRLALSRTLVDHRGHRGVLQRRAATVEHDDLLVRYPSRATPRHDLPQLGAHVGPRHDPPVEGVVKLADGRALLEVIHDHRGRRHHFRLELLLVLVVRADGPEEQARRQVS